MTTVVITGSQSGMGAALRARLEADGQRVIGVDLAGSGAELFEGLDVLADPVGQLTTGQGGVTQVQHGLVPVAFERTDEQVAGMDWVAQQIVTHRATLERVPVFAQNVFLFSPVTAPAAPCPSFGHLPYCPVRA